jgi:transposase
MPTNRVTMRRIREALRLHLQADLSYNEVGLALKISKSVVGKYVSLARAAGVDWDVAQTLDDDALEARLYRPALPRSSQQLAPDFAVVHQELKRADVTLMLLWEEYARDNEQAYKYTSFCIKYREFAKSQLRSMRQIHIAGEKLFVDYAGGAVPIVNPLTGEITRAQIFVATLGASNYTFACATARQTTADWIGAQVRALEFFGGVPRLIVPDQTRALIKRPDRCEPEPNRTYEEFAKHYGCALLAARPAHPRDKPKVEGAVLLVQRWILAWCLAASSGCMRVSGRQRHRGLESTCRAPPELRSGASSSEARRCQREPLSRPAP